MSVILGRLSGAFLLNCELFALTLLFALPLGLVVAFGSMSRCRLLSGAVKTFVWVIRGTPLMLQIIVIYLGPGLLGMNNPWPSGSGGRMVAAVVAFAINYACYFSEIYRGGIEAVPKGQTEAGQVLGMTRTQIFFKVTLLQVVKRILPPMGNEIITLVKDTSLANTIANKEIIMNVPLSILQLTCGAVIMESLNTNAIFSPIDFSVSSAHLFSLCLLICPLIAYFPK